MCRVSANDGVFQLAGRLVIDAGRSQGCVPHFSFWVEPQGWALGAGAEPSDGLWNGQLLVDATLDGRAEMSMFPAESSVRADGTSTAGRKFAAGEADICLTGVVGGEVGRFLDVDFQRVFCG